MDKNSEKKIHFLGVFLWANLFLIFFFYIWLEITFKIHFLAKEYLMACSLSDLPKYRNFWSFTRTADYPHWPIIAYGKKKSQQIARTGG